MLAALQHSWVSALYGTGESSAAGLRGPEDARRFERYRASVMANLTGALADTYPVIQRLVGASFFAGVARSYLRRHPSRQGDIHAFGAEFAEFMAQFEPAASLPYLADIARLEWLTHQAFHAADSPTLEVTRLAELDETALAAARIDFHASLHLLASPFPVNRIWQVNQPNSVAETVDLRLGAVRLAVFRDGLEVALLPLGLGDYTFIRALRTDALGDAIDRAFSQDAAFDPGAALHLLFSQPLVVAVHSGARSCTV